MMASRHCWTTNKYSNVKRREGSHGRAIRVVRAQTGLEIRQSSPLTSLVIDVISAIIRIPPIWEVARANARKRIEERGKEINIDITQGLQLMSSTDWSLRLEWVTDPNLTYPSYYLMPFHAYDKGNLAWEPALEFELVTVAVHADVMDPAKKKVDPLGDATMRSEFHRLAIEVMDEWGCGEVTNAVDLGCAAGVSSHALQRAFPAATVTGLDASPYFIAVADYVEETRGSAASQRGEPIVFRHALAERTGLPDTSTDVVSLSLVSHELPKSAAIATMHEAFRILRPGGVMMIMDMDPNSAGAQRILNSPFAAAAFRATEPWLQEYVTLDMESELLTAGFDRVGIRYNTPSHKVVVARKAA